MSAAVDFVEHFHKKRRQADVGHTKDDESNGPTSSSFFVENQLVSLALSCLYGGDAELAFRVWDVMRESTGFVGTYVLVSDVFGFWRY